MEARLRPVSKFAGPHNAYPNNCTAYLNVCTQIRRVSPTNDNTLDQLIKVTLDQLAVQTTDTSQKECDPTMKMNIQNCVCILKHLSHSGLDQHFISPAWLFSHILLDPPIQLLVYLSTEAWFHLSLLVPGC